MAAPFDKIPTFKEVGIKGLDQEIMWRGFLLNKGTSRQAVTFYETLMKKVSEDPEWKAFATKRGAKALFVGGAQFLKQVKNDEAEFDQAFRELGMK